MSVLSFLGGFSQRMSENWKEDRDAMEVQIRDASNFYRTEGSRRLEERRERKNTLQQRFKTVKLLTGDTQYSKDIASAAIQLDDDSYTDFLARLKKSADEVGTLDATKLQELGLIGAEFKPTDITVDTAVGNVMGVFDKSSVADTKTLGTTAEGLRRHFGTLTPKEIERSAREQAASVLGVGAAELSAITSGDLTFGDASTGVNLGIVDPLAQEAKEIRGIELDTARLNLKNAENTSAEEQAKLPYFTVSTPRVNPITKEPIADMTGYSYDQYLITLANEQAAIKNSRNTLGTAEATRFTRRVSTTLATLDGGTSFDEGSGRWSTDATDKKNLADLTQLSSELGTVVLDRQQGLTIEGSSELFKNTGSADYLKDIVQEEYGKNKAITNLLNKNDTLRSLFGITEKRSVEGTAQKPVITQPPPRTESQKAAQKLSGAGPARVEGEGAESLRRLGKERGDKKFNHLEEAIQYGRGDLKNTIGNFLAREGVLKGVNMAEQNKIITYVVAELMRNDPSVNINTLMPDDIINARKAYSSQ